MNWISKVNREIVKQGLLPDIKVTILPLPFCSSCCFILSSQTNPSKTHHLLSLSLFCFFFLTGTDSSKWYKVLSSHPWWGSRDRILIHYCVCIPSLFNHYLPPLPPISLSWIIFFYDFPRHFFSHRPRADKVANLKCSCTTAKVQLGEQLKSDIVVKFSDKFGNEVMKVSQVVELIDGCYCLKLKTK